MEQAKPRTFTPLVVCGIFLSFVMGACEFIVIGTQTPMAEALGVSIAMIGALVSVFAVAYIIGTPVVTILTARFDRVRVIAGLLFVFAAGNAIPLLVHDYAAIVASRIVCAACCGTMLSLTMAIVMQHTDKRCRAEAVAWVYAGFTIASVVSIPLGYFIADTWGWIWPFAIVLVLALALMVLVHLVFPHDPITEAPDQTGSLSLLKDSRAVLGILITATAVTGLYIFFTYIESTMQFELGIPAEYVSLTLLAYGAACVISNVSSGWLAEKGSMRALVYVFAVQAVLLAVLPLATGFKIAAIAIMFAIGLTMYLVNSPSQIHFVGVAAQSHPAAINFASSLNPVAFNIGAALGAALGGAVVSGLGLHYIGYFSALFAFLALLLVLLLLHIEKKRPVPPVRSW